jgi:hypothetical protein
MLYYFTFGSLEGGGGVRPYHDLAFSSDRRFGLYGLSVY